MPLGKIQQPAGAPKVGVTLKESGTYTDFATSTQGESRRRARME